MFSQEKNPSVPVPSFGSESSLATASSSLSPMAILATIAPNLANGVVTRTVTSAAVNESYQALLTKVVIDNISALSSLEEHLARVSPSAQERIKTAIDAYSIGAIMRLGRM